MKIVMLDNPLCYAGYYRYKRPALVFGVTILTCSVIIIDNKIISNQNN